MTVPESVGEGRFLVGPVVADGATSIVHRGQDRATGQPVAIKVLRESLDAVIDRRRFEREARVLAAIDDPHVVRHVAHGDDGFDRPWLAMEWLEGSDLRAYHDEHPLSAPLAVAMVCEALEGLSALHAQGGVHRDVKPTNFFVIEGEDKRPFVEVIDLGFARRPDDEQLTHVGLRVGTPAYMSPEQAVGEEDVGPASDIYSTGVVLFELLTGEKPFEGKAPLAVLARIVLEEPRRLRKLWPDAPQALDDLVHAALSKRPEDRPPSAGAMVEALRAIEVPLMAEGEPRRRRSAEPTPARAERRIVTTLFAALPKGMGAGTLVAAEAVARRHGARTHRLIGRRMVAVFGSERSRGDEAARAATAGLVLQASQPTLRLAIATGFALAADAGVSGAVIERGAGQLARAAGGIRLDAYSIRLLADLFVVEEQPKGEGLLRRARLGSRRGESRVRRVLGRRAPFVGRERELEELLGVSRAAHAARAPRAALVVGDAGMGKKRLADAFVQALGTEGPRVLLLRGDPARVSLPLSALSRGLRRMSGILDKNEGDDSSAIALDWAENLDIRNTMAVVELLGVADQERRVEDPLVVADRLRGAVKAILRGLARDSTVVVLVEDLQWVDPRSVAVLDECAAIMFDVPMCFVGFGRTESQELFPALWQSANPIQLELGPLAADAAAEFARAVLGAGVGATEVDALVERAEGHPLFLEELLRATAQGDDSLPMAVQSALQVRLDALPPGARQVALAASVLGRTVWREALADMLPRDVGGAISLLTRAEVLDERESSRFEGTHELVFRHRLLREAAYAQLEDEQREELHVAAAEWLESVGERSAVLARHLDLAGEVMKAVKHLVKAADEALAEGAHAIAKRHAERGLELAGDTARAVALHAVAARACHRLGLYGDALRHADAGLATHPSAIRKLHLAASRAMTLRRTGDVEGAIDTLVVALAATRDSAESDPLRNARAGAETELAWTQYNRGRSDDALALATRVLEELPGSGAPEMTATRLSLAHLMAIAQRALGRLDVSLDLHAAVVEQAEARGHGWRAEGARVDHARVQLAVGRLDEATVELAKARDRARALGLPSTRGYAHLFLGVALLRGGDFKGARRQAASASGAGQQLGAEPLAAGGHALHAVASLRVGDGRSAQASCVAVAAMERAPQGWLRVTDGVLALLLIDTGRVEEGLSRAREALPRMGESQDMPEAHDLAADLLVEALRNGGDESSAKEFTRNLEAQLGARLALVLDERVRAGMATKID